MRLTLLLLFLTSALWGDLESHLRKIDDKTDFHAMRNIDFIYLINLDPRPEKWQQCQWQLYAYGIYPYRFSAVNGWELTLEEINDVGLVFSPEMEGGFMGTSYLTPTLEQMHSVISNHGQVYFCHCMARGTIGTVLSHVSLLQDAYDSGYETIWVMEDDIEVLKDPHLISDLIDHLDALVGKDGWDILFTDRDTKDGNGNYSITYMPTRRPDFKGTNEFAMKIEISPEFRKIGARYGAYSMIIRRSGICKLLQFFKAHQVFLPYDLDYINPHGIRLFTPLGDIVSTFPRALSDNGGANYLKK